MYSQINMHGAGPRGQGDLVTRNSAPPISRDHRQPPGHQGNVYDQMHSRGALNRSNNAELMGGHVMRDGMDHQGDIQAALGIPAQLQHPGLSGGLPHSDPPPLPPEKKEVVWVCECTWENKPRRLRCEMCTRERPKDFVVPDDAPMDEAARQAEENERMFQEVSSLT